MKICIFGLVTSCPQKLSKKFFLCLFSPFGFMEKLLELQICVQGEKLHFYQKYIFFVKGKCAG